MYHVQVDNPSNANNLAPYKLVLVALRKLSVIRAGDQVEVGEGNDYILQNGDVVVFTSRFKFK